MKYAIIIIAMAAGLAHGQPVIMNTNIVDSGSIRIVEEYPVYRTKETVNALDDKAIKRAIENGDVCRVRGKHEWRYKAYDRIRWLLRVVDAKGRKCDLCGRKETKQEVWKEGGQ